MSFALHLFETAFWEKETHVQPYATYYIAFALTWNLNTVPNTLIIVMFCLAIVAKHNSNLLLLRLNFQMHNNKHILPVLMDFWPWLHLKEFLVLNYLDLSFTSIMIWVTSNIHTDSLMKFYTVIQSKTVMCEKFADFYSYTYPSFWLVDSTNFFTLWTHKIKHFWFWFYLDECKTTFEIPYK